MSKKVYLKSWGCQMNVRDSEVICGLLRANSYELTANHGEADIVLFNTCSVRQHAEDKVWSEIGRVAKMSPLDSVHEPHRIKAGGTPRPQARKKIIGLVGCMAQNYKEKIFERAPHVDFVVGPSDIDKIPKILERVTRSQGHKVISQPLFEKKIWETDGETRPEEIYHTGFYEDKEHAYVVISEGCSNYCSYCVVPYVRGQLHNRHFEDILKEIEEAVDKGITKITLLGQNVCAYGAETRNQSTETRSAFSFINLLELVNKIKGLRELSFITSHPKDTTTDLFKAMQDLEKLKKYLHLPVQAGSDRILKLMNRGYTRKFYLDLIEKYRKIVEGALLTTDIIVGFPSETEADFQDTYDLLNSAQFNSAYIFKYSARPGTEAAKMADDVSRKEKERRHKLVLDLQKQISKKSKFK